MDRMIASNSGPKVARGELEDNNGITLAGKTSAIQIWQTTLKALLTIKDTQTEPFACDFKQTLDINSQLRPEFRPLRQTRPS
ncbi:MAG: hypothetical protein JO025_04455 [Verrucomicrobia bacterium]|nr:hypothetical protein [Verrucomicrobiota bacterium]